VCCCALTPSSSRIQYKYIIRSSESGEVVEWQPCDNLELDVPEVDIPETAPIVVEDAWEGDEHVVRVEGKGEEPTLAQAVAVEAEEMLQGVSLEEALEEFLTAEVPLVNVAEAVFEEAAPEVATKKPADTILQVRVRFPVILCKVVTGVNKGMHCAHRKYVDCLLLQSVLEHGSACIAAWTQIEALLHEGQK
jgi:hypothetical protein